MQSHRWHPRVVQSATCPVRELSSPRVDQSASRPVRELAIRELSSNPHVVLHSKKITLVINYPDTWRVPGYPRQTYPEASGKRSGTYRRHVYMLTIIASWLRLDASRQLDTSWQLPALVRRCQMLSSCRRMLLDAARRFPVASGCFQTLFNMTQLKWVCVNHAPAALASVWTMHWPYWLHQPYSVYMAILYTKQGTIKLSKMLMKSTHHPLGCHSKRSSRRTAQTSDAV